MSVKREFPDKVSPAIKNRKEASCNKLRKALTCRSSKCDRMLKSLDVCNMDISRQGKNLKEKMTLTAKEKDALMNKAIETEKLKSEGERHKQQLHHILGELQRATEWSEIGSISDQTDTCEEEVADWFKKCDGWCKSFETDRVDMPKRKILEVIKSALDSRMIKLADGSEFNFADVIVKATLPLILDKQIVETGKMAVVQEKDGQRRYARLTTDGDAICLHHLQDQHPTSANIFVPYDAVFTKVDVPSALTFLDLSWPNSRPRRVYIRMEPEKTYLGWQFVLMCSAMEGPTYAQTKLKEVRSKGRKGEYVVGGVVGKAIVKIEENDEQCMEEGIVAAEGSSARQFRICTIESLNKFCKPFGRVERGLDVLKEAAALGDVTRVTIVDCGLMVPKISHMKSDTF